MRAELTAPQVTFFQRIVLALCGALRYKFPSYPTQWFTSLLLLQTVGFGAGVVPKMERNPWRPTHMPFTDAYHRTIDAKNRIQVPAQFRSEMDPEVHGTAFHLCPGERQNTLSLYPQRTFERRAEQLRTEQISGEDSLAFEQMYFSLASKLEMDKQGRVVLPERQLALVNLGEEIVLAGANTRIDIWAKKDYEQFIQSSFVARWGALQKFMRQSPDRGASD